MSITLRVFLLLLILVMFFMILHTVKKYKMSIRYILIWLFLLVVLLFIVIFPNVLISITSFFGFEKTSNMVFLIGYFILFYLVFIQSVENSIMKKEITNLVQELSLLKKDKKDGKD